MNIWLIQIGESLPTDKKARKLRTALVADKLIEKGHSILWWASAFDHFKKDWVFKEDTEFEVRKNLKIKALKGIGYKKNISLSRFVDHRIISRKFKKLTQKYPKPDIIVASLPSHDLAYEAVIYAKKNDIPVIVDIRDPWPDIFLNHIPTSMQKLFKLIIRKDFLMVKEIMKKADSLISMMDTLLNWGLQHAERIRTSKDRVFYLGYKKPLNGDVNAKGIQQLLEQLDNKFVVTFIGTFASYHNPAILIEAAKRLKEKEIYFVLAGNGEFFNEIKENSSKINNIILPGWLNQDEITALLQHSNIGVCPATKVADFFPNKSFAYLSESLPTISAFQGDLKEIIEKYQIGFYYPPNDVDSLVCCIKKLYEDKELYKKMSENAHRVFDEMFDADKIYEEYVEHIELIAEQYKKERKLSWN